jgi:hypothetical protein
MEERRQRLVLQALALLVVCHNAVLGVEASPAPLAKGNITRSSQVFGKTCTDLGFSGLQLCSDCKLMARYVSNKELVADCYDCCAEEKTFSNIAVKYVSAVLEICN